LPFSITAAYLSCILFSISQVTENYCLCQWDSLYMWYFIII
jgi:hypothetical protein